MPNDLMTRANYHLNRGSDDNGGTEDRWLMEKRFEYAINERNHWWQLEMVKANHASAERVQQMRLDATLDTNSTRRYEADRRRFGGREEAIEEDVEKMFEFDKGEITDEKIRVTNFN
ncbi:MAG: hypothetical protein FWF59_05335 [Turicibacter sp.]|nr:hypothetical protein [Turicibacter sp.]